MNACPTKQLLRACTWDLRVCRPTDTRGYGKRTMAGDYLVPSRIWQAHKGLIFRQPDEPRSPNVLLCHILSRIPHIPHYLLIRFGPLGLPGSGAFLLTCATLQDHQHGLGVEERDYEPLPIEIWHAVHFQRMQCISDAFASCLFRTKPWFQQQ